MPPVGHPLEPLSQDELADAVTILRADRRLNESHRFGAITLNEPPKEVFLAWEASGANGNGLAREAAALLVDRASGVTTEAVVSLTDKAVTAWNDLDGQHAPYLLEEFMEAIEVAKADAGWRAALERRGVTDFDSVQCDPWPAGNFGVPEEQGRRLARVVSYVRDHEADNGYAHPIEGVVATVDLVEKRVLDLMDGPVIPVPQRQWNYGTGDVGPLREDLKTVEITQPDGPSFTMEGNEIRWQRWRVRVSMHPVDGLVIHTVGYEDPRDGRVRPILYRAALGEMVVPYGDTASATGGRTRSTRASSPSAVSRSSTRSRSAATASARSATSTRRRSPRPASRWRSSRPSASTRRTTASSGSTSTSTRSPPRCAGRRRLVVSSIHTVGNYEYGFYWYFYLDGTLQLEVKLTGILQTMAVARGRRPGARQPRGPAGRGAVPPAPLLLPARPRRRRHRQLRLRERAGGRAGGRRQRASATRWSLSRTLLARESEAQRDVDAHRSRSWTVVNNGRTNARRPRRSPTGCCPGSAPTLLAGEGSAIAERAAFARHNLWVTPYHDDERRAAGHPVCHPGGAGLPEFTAGDRDLIDTDVVLWYSFGSTTCPGRRTGR